MSLLDLLFPKICLKCGKQGGYICKNCLLEVETINNLDQKTNSIQLFKYDGVVRKAIIKLKYNFAFDIASELASICTQNLEIISKKYSFKNPILIPVPLHPSRLRWRGFNQTQILGEIITKNMNWSIENNLLTRKIQGKTQVGLRGIDRVRNIRGKFAVNSKAKLYQNRTYIVFDDVATTGSTIKEAINTLKKAGIQKIIGLTIAA